MPRGVNDIDPIIVPRDRSIFGQNGNATLTFLIIGIHDPLSARIFAIQGAGLLQQAVDQRGFAVVNVGDNGDIAKRFHAESNELMCARRLAGAECTPPDQHWFNRLFG